MTHHGHDSAFHDEQIVAVLETEAELAAGITGQAIALCAGRLGEVRRIVDLGCGPGVAACALAEAFPAATVVAVDGSPVVLARAAERAARLGVARRVEPRSLDLNGDLRPLGGFDLVWAAQALHHAEDEAATLRRFAALLAPHGLLCLTERAEPLVVRCADELGRPGIWDRIESAQRGTYPATDYGGMLEQIGLELLERRTLIETVVTPDEPAVRSLIARHLRGAERKLGLDEADSTALATLNSEGRAEITSSRTVFFARTVL